MLFTRKKETDPLAEIKEKIEREYRESLATIDREPSLKERYDTIGIVRRHHKRMNDAFIKAAKRTVQPEKWRASIAVGGLLGRMSSGYLGSKIANAAFYPLATKLLSAVALTGPAPSLPVMILGLAGYTTLAIAAAAGLWMSATKLQKWADKKVEQHAFKTKMPEIYKLMRDFNGQINDRQRKIEANHAQELMGEIAQTQELSGEGSLVSARLERFAARFEQAKKREAKIRIEEVQDMYEGTDVPVKGVSLKLRAPQHANGRR